MRAVYVQLGVSMRYLRDIIFKTHEHTEIFMGDKEFGFMVNASYFGSSNIHSSHFW